MNNDSHLLSEKYQVISEAKPFGIGSRLWSGAKSKFGLTSTQRASGQVASNFAKNVNRYYDQFNAWLVTQPNQKPTVGNFVKYFNEQVGLSTQSSPTLTKLTKTEPQAVTDTYNDFMRWSQQPTQQSTPQPNVQ